METDPDTMARILAAADKVDGKPITPGTAAEILRTTTGPRMIAGSGLLRKARVKKEKKIADRLIEAKFEVSFNFVSFIIPVKLESASTNRGVFNKGNMGRGAKYRKAWFKAFPYHLRDCLFLVEAAHRGEPVYVLITRLGRQMDDDNLTGAAKELRDAVAMSFGLQDDPNGPLKWDVDQKTRIVNGAVVTIGLSPPPGFSMPSNEA